MLNRNVGAPLPVEQLVAVTLYGPQDYAILGYKPQSVEGS